MAKLEWRETRDQALTENILSALVLQAGGEIKISYVSLEAQAGYMFKATFDRTGDYLILTTWKPGAN